MLEQWWGRDHLLCLCGASTPAAVQGARAVQGGEAVFQLLQTTGQALSPVMEKLAGMMEDDPTQAAAFR